MGWGCQVVGSLHHNPTAGHQSFARWFVPSIGPRTHMPGPQVRADYDALKNVAQGFSQQADETAKSLQALQGQMDTLHGGDWIGQGATAFYAEMNDQVLPTIKRLQSALQTSADITQKISQAMKSAEDEAAKVLRGAGAAGAL